MTVTLLRAWWLPLEVENGAWVRFGVGVISLGFIMLSRLLNSFHTPSKQETTIFMARSAVSGVLYILLTLFSVLIPIPAGGITPEILNHVYPDRGSGIWEEEPQRALAAGAIYFFILGLFELMVSGGALNERSKEEATQI